MRSSKHPLHSHLELQCGVMRHISPRLSFGARRLLVTMTHGTSPAVYCKCTSFHEYRPTIHSQIDSIVANISWSQTLDAQYPVLKTSARPDGAREFIHSRFFLSSVRPLTRCLRILLSSKVHPLSSCRLASSEKCMGAIVIIVPDRSVSMSNRKFPRRRRSECAS